MRQRILYKICPIAILLIVFLAAISFSLVHVSAGDSFVENSAAWSNTNNSLYASQASTYPYNDPNTKIKSVALDILYGASKGFGLTQYHGEAPYAQVYDSSGDSKADGFSKIYAREGTTISGTNPDGVDAKTYWGFDSSTHSSLGSSPKSAKLSEYEKINDSEVVSLRLYALSHTTGGFWGGLVQILSNALYSVGVFLAWLSTLILSLIIGAKNIDMEEIMNFLNLQKISEIMTSSFIFDGTAFALSPFALFAIIMFIFALVAYGVRYAKGLDKSTGLKDIITTALVGVLVIGMCLSGKLVTLGSVGADVANQMMVTMADVANGGAGDAFVTNVQDDEHTNKVAQISEMSMVNKIFIDMQICAQFGVSDIKELNVITLGDTGAKIANYGLNGSSDLANGLLMRYINRSSYPTGVSNTTMEKEFDNNLGYYYWFANTAASEKTVGNANFPATNAASVDEKLGSMITYLQAVYNQNKAAGKTAENQQIVKMVSSLAIPNGASGFVSMFLLTAILVVMGICVFRYCLNVVIGKLEIFIAILGLAVAGPLLLTTNKKLVQTGKTIIGMIPVALIEITVYSIVFDIILFLVASLMSTNILQLLVVLFLILLLMKLNPLLQEKIKQLLDSTTRTISPAFANSKRAIKAYTRQKANDIMNSYDKSTKVVGYDKNGKEILQERGGDALSKLMRQGYNAVYNDGAQRESVWKINKKQTELHANNTNRSAEEIRRDAEARVNDVLTDIKDRATNLENQEQAIEKEYREEKYTINGDETVYVDENLTEEEKSQIKEIKNLKAEAEAIKDGAAYKKLMAEKTYIERQNAEHKGDENYTEKVLDEDKVKKLQALINQIDEKLKLASQKDSDLKKSIDEEARIKAYDDVGLIENVEGATAQEKLKNATLIKAQKEKETNLRTTLLDGVNAVKEEVNTKQTTKIGSSTATVNRAAVTTNAAMLYQLKQLEAGVIVSDTNNAKSKVEDVVDTIVQYNDKHAGHSEVTNAKKELKETNKVFFNKYHDKEERANAQERAAQMVEDAKDDIKTERKIGRDNYKTTKEEYGRTGLGNKITGQGRAEIDEQLATMMNGMEVEDEIRKKSLAKAINEKANTYGDYTTKKPETETSEFKSTKESTTENSTEAKPQTATATANRWDAMIEREEKEAAKKIKISKTAESSEVKPNESTTTTETTSTENTSTETTTNKSEELKRKVEEKYKDVVKPDENTTTETKPETKSVNTAKPINTEKQPDIVNKDKIKPDIDRQPATESAKPDSNQASTPNNNSIDKLIKDREQANTNTSANTQQATTKNAEVVRNTSDVQSVQKPTQPTQPQKQPDVIPIVQPQPVKPVQQPNQSTVTQQPAQPSTTSKPTAQTNTTSTQQSSEKLEDVVRARDVSSKETNNTSQNKQSSTPPQTETIRDAVDRHETKPERSTSPKVETIEKPTARVESPREEVVRKPEPAKPEKPKVEKPKADKTTVKIDPPKREAPSKPETIEQPETRWAEINKEIDRHEAAKPEPTRTEPTRSESRVERPTETVERRETKVEPSRTSSKPSGSRKEESKDKTRVKFNPKSNIENVKPVPKKSKADYIREETREYADRDPITSEDKDLGSTDFWASRRK